jgi:hypothetical protein
VVDPNKFVKLISRLQHLTECLMAYRSAPRACRSMMSSRNWRPRRRMRRPTFRRRRVSAWLTSLLPGKVQQYLCVHVRHTQTVIDLYCNAFRQVPAVERYVVVHGQIILNQFKHLPSKAIKASAFPAALRSALEQRRHLKLYASAAKTTSRVNRNPMKVRVSDRPGDFNRTRPCVVIESRVRRHPVAGFLEKSCSSITVLQDRSGPNRLKPMAATATAMVKAIWARYFQLGSNAEAAEAAEEGAADGDAAAAAKAVEEVRSCQAHLSALLRLHGAAKVPGTWYACWHQFSNVAQVPKPCRRTTTKRRRRRAPLLQWSRTRSQNPRLSSRSRPRSRRPLRRRLQRPLSPGWAAWSQLQMAPSSTGDKNILAFDCVPCCSSTLHCWCVHGVPASAAPLLIIAPPHCARTALCCAWCIRCSVMLSDACHAGRRRSASWRWGWAMWCSLGRQTRTAQTLTQTQTSAWAWCRRCGSPAQVQPSASHRPCTSAPCCHHGGVPSLAHLLWLTCNTPHRHCCCSTGAKHVQLRGMLRGAATVLGDAASDIELFLTDDLITRCASAASYVRSLTCCVSAGGELRP